MFFPKPKFYCDRKNLPTPWNLSSLPSNLYPAHYDISLVLNLTDSSVSGRVFIVFNVVRSTDYIIFHVGNQSVTNVSISNKYVILEEFRVPENQYYVIKVDQCFREREVIRVAFQISILIDDANLAENFPLKRFFNDSASTESSNATFTSALVSYLYFGSLRQLVPCLDEPRFVSQFTLSLSHHHSYHLHTSMPLAEVSHSTRTQYSWLHVYLSNHILNQKCRLRR